MRKSINGLVLFVEQELKLNPFEKYLFIFCGRRKDRIKILYWDKTGFALWYKRLEKENYCLPKQRDNFPAQLSPDTLKLFLDGYDVWKIKPHKSLCYSTFS